MDYDTDGTWWLGCEPTEPDYDRGYWTTKDDRRLKIETMETSHIKNTINLLKRNISKLEDYEKEYYEDYFEFKINELEEELKKRDVYKRHLESYAKFLAPNGISKSVIKYLARCQVRKD